MESADTTEEKQNNAWRASRLRGVRFLAEHALVAGDAYSFHVAHDGQVNIQGSLQRLAQLLEAQPITPARQS